VNSLLQLPNFSCNWEEVINLSLPLQPLLAHMHQMNSPHTRMICLNAPELADSRDLIRRIQVKRSSLDKKDKQLPKLVSVISDRK